MKKLYTSYFAKSKNHPLAYAISVAVPYWAPKLKHCPTLAPSAHLLYAFKYTRMTEAAYAAAYLEEMRTRNRSAQDVVDSLPDGAVLLCYEKTGKFCHRHLAAKWLMENADVEVAEL